MWEGTAGWRSCSATSRYSYETRWSTREIEDNLNQNLRDGGLVGGTWGIVIQAGKRKYVEPIQILILSLLHQML